MCLEPKLEQFSWIRSILIIWSQNTTKILFHENPIDIFQKVQKKLTFFEKIDKAQNESQVPNVPRTEVRALFSNSKNSHNLVAKHDQNFKNKKRRTSKGITNNDYNPVMYRSPFEPEPLSTSRNAAPGTEDGGLTPLATGASDALEARPAEGVGTFLGRRKVVSCPTF